MGQDPVFRKVAWRLIPFLIVLYIVSFLDRVNVGFAALEMNADLGFSGAVFGLGAGMFFVAYVLFEVPSNLLMEKFGARIWIARIMITWGLVSGAMAFVSDATDFYVLRFLLGIAEAGFFPGIMFYLTHWFPTKMRAQFVAIFMLGIPLASVIGAPISGALLEMQGVGGLAGWQWMFLLEAAPAVLLGFTVFFYLPNGPKDAKWLTEAERNMVLSELAKDPEPQHHDWAPALRDYRTWLLGFSMFGIVTGLYGIGLWLPQIVKGMGFSNFETGLVAAIPYIAAAIAMVWWARRSDIKNERVWHTSLPAMLAAVGFVWSAYAAPGVESLVALTVTSVGIYATLGPFWGLPAIFLRGTAAAAGFALMNSVANTGGFVGPAMMGWLKDTTGGYEAGLIAFAAAALMTAILIFVVARSLQPRSG